MFEAESYSCSIIIHGNKFSGSIYLWGDFDQPMPGMPSGTHLRILKITGFETINPPPYDDASKKPASPPFTPQGSGAADVPSYPTLGFALSGSTQNMTQYQQNAPYPQNNLPYPHNEPFYPSGQATLSHEQLQGYAESGPYPQSENHQNSYQGSTAQPPYGGVPGQYTGQRAYYPPQGKQNCCLQ